MGILRYVYHCHDCGEDKYSYFKDTRICVYCQGKNVEMIDISAKKIEKFSDEGIKLRKKEIETDWSGRE